MKKTASFLILAMTLLALSTRIFAQRPTAAYIQETLEFNITDISLFDERIFFIHDLLNDGRFEIKASEEDGVLLINASDAYEDLDLSEAFSEFRRQNSLSFSRMDKETASDIACEYKAQLPADICNSLMMDIYAKSRQNNLCSSADPFCTDNGLYEFPAGTNAGYGEAGPNYNCLNSTPNPAWYYMRIGTPGNISIYMYSTPGYDIDFCCWGPFSDPVTPCPTGLGSSKVVSCSYSSSATETCNIPATAQAGEYYILVITNYSNQTCNISFSKNGGNGTTDCGIMPPLVDNGGPYCVGETIQLNANGQSGATYSWTGPGGWTSNHQNPTRSNCTMDMAGTYTCTIAVGSQTNSASTEVTVGAKPTANFTFTTGCKGTPTRFTSTSTTNPSGQNMTYLWNFGDGSTSTEQNPSHTYAQAGDYTVRLTAKTENGACSSEKTQLVPVYAVPAPRATARPNVVIYGGTAQLTATAGVAGTFNFHWEPADKVTNPNSASTSTVGLQSSQTFTVTVTNPQGGCSNTAQVTVSIEGSSMTAIADADSYEICEGESTTLHAQPSGGTGNYTYSWSPANTLDNATSQDPVATPATGTTRYTCTVSDGYTTQNAEVSITVHPKTESHPAVTICPGETYHFFGQDLTAEGTYTQTTTNHFGCDSIIHLSISHYDTYETSIVQTICSGDTYTFFGQPLTSAGQYSHTLQSVHGCDSTIILTLRLNPSYENDIDRSFCSGSSYPFNGQELTEPGDYDYHGQTVLGCDSIVHLHLHLTDYNSKVYDIDRCNQPYTWPPTGEQFTEIGSYYRIDTIAGPYCDSIVTLNLNIYTDFPDVEFHVTQCDNHTWANYGGRPYTENGELCYTGKTYDRSGDYIRHYQSVHGCDSIVTMHLTINPSKVSTPHKEACNTYEWAEAGIVFEESVINFEHHFSTTLGCDSLVKMNVDMEYTPSPTTIEPTDHASNPFGHWVITATEFQINTYSFSVREKDHPTCHWDNVEWSIHKKNGESVNWPIETHDNNRIVNVYVLQFVPDTVWLTAKIFNKCAPEGIEVSYYLICSFYGVEEQYESHADVNIVPNPNQGVMTLNFEYLTGKVNIKVYDMKGNQIDNFNTQNAVGPNSLQYSMADFADGMYLFVVTSKDASVTKKVLICR